MASVYKYFELPKNRDGNFKAKCKQFDTLLSCSKGVTSNLLKHVKVNLLLFYTGIIQSDI